MKTSILLPTISLTLGFALACSGGSAPAPEAPAATQPAAATHIGVPECDEYVRKMEACLGSMDPAMVAAMAVPATAQARQPPLYQTEEWRHVKTAQTEQRK